MSTLITFPNGGHATASEGPVTETITIEEAEARAEAFSKLFAGPAVNSAVPEIVVRDLNPVAVWKKFNAAPQAKALREAIVGGPQG